MAVWRLPPMQLQYMNILIVKTSAIGDVTHTLPALNALRNHYPDAKITWLVEQAAADIIRGHRSLDRVLVSRRKYWAREMGSGFSRFLLAWKEARVFIRELRDTRYDLLLDFQGLLKSGIFVWLARADRKVGFGRGMEHSECSYIFLNERIPPVNMDTHALQREMLLLEAIGVEAGELVFDLPISEQNRTDADTLLASHGIDQGKKLIAINPQATWPTKLWISERFAEVADHLLESGCAVVFTGSSGDRDEIDHILAMMKGQAVNLAGETSLLSLAALYQMAAAVVSTDTGPMHIAAATGTPLVAIFGSTAPWRTGPWGDQHKIIRLEMACSPCLKKMCDKDFACMEQLTAEVVIKAVDEILKRQAG